MNICFSSTYFSGCTIQDFYQVKIDEKIFFDNKTNEIDLLKLKKCDIRQYVSFKYAHNYDLFPRQTKDEEIFVRRIFLLNKNTKTSVFCLCMSITNKYQNSLYIYIYLLVFNKVFLMHLNQR